MGIRHLYPYVDEYNKNSTDRPSARVNNNIYTPKTLYIDLTSKVISFVMQYQKHNEKFIQTHPIEEVLPHLISSLRGYLLTFLHKQSKFHKNINIFSDIIPVAEDQCFIYDLFSDFIKNKRLNKDERVRSIVLIRRDDINRLMKYNDDYNKIYAEMYQRTNCVYEEQYTGEHLQLFNKLIEMLDQKHFGMSFDEFLAQVVRRTRYLHSYISVSSLFDVEDDIRDYVSLHYVLEQYGVEISDVVSTEDAYGKRFLRASQTRDLMNVVKENRNNDNTVSAENDSRSKRKLCANDPNLTETIMYPYVNVDYDIKPLTFSLMLSKRIVDALEFIEDMVLKRYLVYVSAKFSVKQTRKQHKQTPKLPCVPTVLYLIGPLIEDIVQTNKFGAEINIFGCEMEADFALLKHVNTYNKRSFPVIDSPDTDMLCNLCDVPCLIHMKRTYPFKGDVKSPLKTKEYYINPVNFWKFVFKGKVLNKNIIKILCVLLGTDYNPYDKSSPIHIKSFDEILEKMNVKEYSEIDEDALRLYVYDIMCKHPTDKHVIATALALNMYLADELECKIHNLNEELRTVRADLNNPAGKRTIVKGKLLSETVFEPDDVNKKGIAAQRLFENRRIEFDTIVKCPAGMVFEDGDLKQEHTRKTVNVLRRHVRAKDPEQEGIYMYESDEMSPFIQFDDCIRGLSYWN